MIKILFICHGNICRSPMAEFVMKDMVCKRGIQADFEIASAATTRDEIGNDIHPGTKGKLRQMQIPFSKRAARQITKSDYLHYDYLLGMDTPNINSMLRIIGHDEEHKIYRLLDFAQHPRDIADPWFTHNFDETYEDVVEGCEALLKHLGY